VRTQRRNEYNVHTQNGWQDGSGFGLVRYAVGVSCLAFHCQGMREYCFCSGFRFGALVGFVVCLAFY